MQTIDQLREVYEQAAKVRAEAEKGMQIKYQTRAEFVAAYKVHSKAVDAHIAAEAAYWDALGID
jgi:hypothetical protein